MKKLLLIIALVCFARVSMAQQPNLLTSQTPFNYTLPAGWTAYSAESFESGNCSGNAGAYCNGIFTTLQHHNDGNPANTHSMGCTYGDYSGGTLPCNSSVSWNRPLPVGTGEVYVSFYEWVDTTFRMNDEFFLTRFHWDKGNGQPDDREAILDYFQNNTGTYNSTDAELLWNIQGQPYYQNKLPGNRVNDNTNWAIPTGRWRQVEIYTKFSTVSLSKPISGTVTVNATAKTYTRSQGSWITDGVAVGASPHFVGFANSDNNGAGDSGGGGTSYFVTAVTATTMTVSDLTNRMVNEGPVSNLVYQVDNADGAYSLYQDGVLQAFQTNMVNPGKDDFSTANTTLSIGESYSKLIWRAAVGGNCVTSAPFSGTCQSVIGGGQCGYEQIPLGWNSLGFTKASAGGAYNVPIDCAPSPMPNPPVFNRYFDDLIVLTKSRSVTPTTTVQPATIAASADSCGQYQTITFPQFSKFRVGSGTSASCGLAGTSGQGLIDFWDLKNDPTAQWDFGGYETGTFEHQWGVKNFNGTTRYNEVKEGPMAITVTESNNVRVKLTQAGAVRSVGLLTNAADCCMTMTKTYVFYRHGGSTKGSGASKVYTKTTINYDNADGLGPLTTAGTGTGINVYNKISWAHVSGEVNNQTNQIGPCLASSGLVPFTASPWTMQYKGSGTNANKDYILLTPGAANSSVSGEFIPANGCVSPTTAQQGPTPAQIWSCNTPTSAGCASQTASPAIVRTNFLQIQGGQQCNYMSLASLAPYFGGGLRIYCALQNSATFNTNVPVSWSSVGFLGDNGISTTTVADSYSTEYKTPPTLTMTIGTGGAFDANEGYWTMAAVNNAVAFTSSGVMHSPAFNISAYTSAVPSTLTVDGANLILDTDYVAVKTDSTHLLLQILQDVTAVSSGSGVSTFTISPKTATINVNATQQMTASSSAYWFTNQGTIDNNGLYTAPASPTIATITGSQQTMLVTNLQTQSNWQTCGNCGDSGGPNPQPNGTFVMTPGNPATFSAAGNYPYNNGFWYYTMLPAGGFNSTVDLQLSFDTQFPTQADKNASQAVEFELQKNYLDQQYSMAWQICFACGNTLRVFNKTSHAWEDTGLTFDPAIFAGGKWVSINTVYHLTTGTPGVTRHVSIAINGVNHVVNIDHATTPAVEGDYLHPAYQLDSNSTFTPYVTKVRNFNVGVPNGATATATITSVAALPLTLSPTTWPFSQVNVNTNVSQAYTMSNAGSTPLTVTGFTKTGSGNFVVTQNTCSLNATVVAGGTCLFTVQFNAAAASTFTGNIAITDSHGGSNSLALSTTTVIPQAPPTITPSSATLPVNGTQQFTTNFTTGQAWSRSCSGGGGSITASGFFTSPAVAALCTVTITDSFNRSASASVTVTSALTPSPTSVNFGSILAGQATNSQVVLKNDNTVSLTISTISVAGTPFGYVPGLSTCKVATVLAPQTSCFLTLSFLAPSAGSFTGTATVTDSAKGSLAIPLSGVGQVPSAVSVSPTSYAWGNVRSGTTSNATFVVTNFGPVNVTVTSLTVTGTGFSSGTGTCFNGIVMSPQASCTAVVTFAPNSATTFTGNLAIIDNSPHTTNLALTGTGTTPPSIAHIKFRKLAVRGPLGIR